MEKGNIKRTQTVELSANAESLKLLERFKKRSVRGLAQLTPRLPQKPHEPLPTTYRGNIKKSLSP
ncbi:MAG TPA: hypothetical protein VEF91_01625 [Verrucomicrobiae bacterium]|nr:hypothetical protein [Verrucomicrobiae bacterium]